MHLWNQLIDDEKEELLTAYNESFDDDNLLSHNEVKSQHTKWLSLDNDSLTAISD